MMAFDPSILVWLISLTVILTLSGCTSSVTSEVIKDIELTPEEVIEEPMREIDQRCSEKVTATGDCDKIVSGWEYNEEANKCSFKLISFGCEDDGKPFSSEETCKDSCKK